MNKPILYFLTLVMLVFGCTPDNDEVNLDSLKKTICAFSPIQNISPPLDTLNIVENDSIKFQFIRNFPIYVLQAMDDNGGRLTNISLAEINIWLDRANEVFKDANIQFTFDGMIHPIRDTRINSVSGENDTNWQYVKQKLNSIATSNGKILIVFRHGGNSIPTGAGFSSWVYDFVVMPAYSNTGICGMSNPSLLTHELGHYFGLEHTFKEEFQTKTNAENYLKNSGNPKVFDGDLTYIHDTPPDPFIRNLDCNASINTVLLNGINFPLLRDNPMAYWYNPKPKKFTKDQIKRIQKIASRRYQGTCNSRFISQNLPTSLAVNTETNVFLTFENTGTLPWETNYQLKPIYNGVLFPEQKLNKQVLPGEKYTFNFPIKFFTPGIYKVQWSMYSFATCKGKIGVPSDLVEISVENTTDCEELLRKIKSTEGYRDFLQNMLHNTPPQHKGKLINDIDRVNGELGALKKLVEEKKCN